ncbi:hypothetical protein HKX48_004329 [Thoreauomyces humboldtii]|nr:hypothetical protein HKX48_004329 [Thoreauomyces humboldtii]
MIARPAQWGKIMSAGTQASDVEKAEMAELSEAIIKAIIDADEVSSKGGQAVPTAVKTESEGVFSGAKDTSAKKSSWMAKKTGQLFLLRK